MMNDDDLSKYILRKMKLNMFLLHNQQMQHPFCKILNDVQSSVLQYRNFQLAIQKDFKETECITSKYQEVKSFLTK
jgi:hypothetical protein